MDKSAGFFSTFFFSLNHYIYCKKNNISFQLDTHNWLYKSLYGWTDYFRPIDFQGSADNKDEVIIKRHNELLGDFSVQEYRDVILNDVYKYDEDLQKIIEEKKRIYHLHPGTYDAIYIRRGDKLLAESQYKKADQYAELLLQKNPDCKRIFLQTDDYNSFLELNDYIHRNNLPITVLTFCEPSSKGVIVYDTKLEIQSDNCVIRGDPFHQEYFGKVERDLKNTKTLDKMDSQEIKAHMIDLLLGVEIVLHSQYCILDKYSNVSRFISIAHDQYNNVFDARYPEENMQMYWTKCPAYW